MNLSDQRNHNDEDDRPAGAGAAPSYPPKRPQHNSQDMSGKHLPHSPCLLHHAHSPAEQLPSLDNVLPEFTLLVAGCRGGQSFFFFVFRSRTHAQHTFPFGAGKSSFLRLLLDTSQLSPNTSAEQLNSVARFVNGCSSRTSFIRQASIDIDVDVDGKGATSRLALNLIDTPSLDFEDPSYPDRVADIMRHIDSRFAEGVDDVSASPSSLLTFLTVHRNGAARPVIVSYICTFSVLSAFSGPFFANTLCYQVHLFLGSR